MRRSRSDIAKRKSAQLSVIEKQLEKVETQIAQEQKEIVAKKMNTKLRYKRLIMAGLVLEDAGILENFDPNALYHLILQHRDSLVRNNLKGEKSYEQSFNK